MEKLTMEFETQEKKDDFIAWLLDAGGEDSYQDFLDFTDKDFCNLSAQKNDAGEVIEITIK